MRYLPPCLTVLAFTIHVLSIMVQAAIVAQLATDVKLKCALPIRTMVLSVSRQICFHIRAKMWYNNVGGLTVTGKKRWPSLILVVLVLASGLLACGRNHVSGTPRPDPGAFTPLPQPVLTGSASLEELLARRRSVRAFDDQPLTAADLGQLLWAAQGITNPRGFRTAPSAGALYPLEVYVATAEGVFRYAPHNHQLLVTSHGDARMDLYQGALNQDPIRQAPAVFIVTAVYERTAKKYGDERAPRYVHLEAGHAAQNLLLEAVALELGAVPIGAFYDEAIQKALGLPSDHTPLYLIPVGHESGTSP
jgi:SagB-type dehydrogenase family enzyme